MGWGIGNRDGDWGMNASVKREGGGRGGFSLEGGQKFMDAEWGRVQKKGKAETYQTAGAQ